MHRSAGERATLLHAIDRRLSIFLHRIKEIRDQRAVVVVRESHRVGARASRREIGFHFGDATVLMKYLEFRAGDNGTCGFADEFDAFGKARIGCGGRVDHAERAIREFHRRANQILVCTPIFLPVIKQSGIDPVHFGMIMTLNLGIGLLTPPVGPTLVVGCAIGKVTMEAVTKSIWPFYLPMLIVLLLVTYIPELSLWLPRILLN